MCLCNVWSAQCSAHTLLSIHTLFSFILFSPSLTSCSQRRAVPRHEQRERERERAVCYCVRLGSCCHGNGQVVLPVNWKPVRCCLYMCVCACVPVCSLCQPMRCLSSLYLIELHISGIQYINRNCHHSSRRSSKTRLVFLVWENTWNLYLTSTTCAILKRVFFSPLVQWLWLFCTKTQIYLVWIFVLLVLCMWDSGPNLCVFNLGLHTVWTHKCSCLIMKLSVSCYVLVICLCVFMLYLYIWE